MTTTPGTVLGVLELADSREVTLSAGEGATYTRKFLVRISAPNTPLIKIVAAVGVGMFSKHPEDRYAVCTSLDAKPRGGSLLVWSVIAKYVPDTRNRGEQQPNVQPVGLPPTVWTGGSKIVEVGSPVDLDGKLIANSAGVAFKSPYVRKPEATLSAVKAYADITAARSAINAVTGAVNNAAWAGGAKGEWCCESSKWQHKIESVGDFALAYVEVVYEFTYRKGGHNLLARDLGFSEKGSDGKLKAILGSDGKPVKEPVALNGSGAALAGNGLPPIVNGGNGFRLNELADFSALVGDPT